LVCLGCGCDYAVAHGYVAVFAPEYACFFGYLWGQVLNVDAAVDYGGVADFSLFFSENLAYPLDRLAYDNCWDNPFFVLLEVFEFF